MVYWEVIGMRMSGRVPTKLTALRHVAATCPTRVGQLHDWQGGKQVTQARTWFGIWGVIKFSQSVALRLNTSEGQAISNHLKGHDVNTGPFHVRFNGLGISQTRFLVTKQAYGSSYVHL